MCTDIVYHPHSITVSQSHHVFQYMLGNGNLAQPDRLPRLIIGLLRPAVLTHPMIDAHLNGSFPDQMEALRLMVEVLQGIHTSLRIL